MVSDEEMLLALKNKDRAAYNLLYTGYAPLLYGIVEQLTARPHQAEYMLHTCMVRIWCDVATYEPRQGRLFTWMLRIVGDECRKQLLGHYPTLLSLLKRDPRWTNR